MTIPRRLRDAAGMRHNGLPVDPVKDRAWRQAAAKRYADRRAVRAVLRTSDRAHTRRSNDWPADVRRLAYQRSGGVCEIDGLNQATHLHHRKLRRHGDHTVANALHVCGACHQRIHRGVDASIAAGWIVPAYADPAATAALLADLYAIPGDPETRRVLLTDAGTYQAAA